MLFLQILASGSKNLEFNFVWCKHHGNTGFSTYLHNYIVFATFELYTTQFRHQGQLYTSLWSVVAEARYVTFSAVFAAVKLFLSKAVIPCFNDWHKTQAKFSFFRHYFQWAPALDNLYSSASMSWSGVPLIRCSRPSFCVFTSSCPSLPPHV